MENSNRPAGAFPGETLSKSVYIHIPFCVRKCAYCDFTSFPGCEGRIGEYVDAVCREIELSKAFFLKEQEDEFKKEKGQKNLSGSALSTIYFGGGTPSLLSPEMVEKILEKLREVFGISEACEITLEANPGTIDEEKLRAFKNAGVNRLSLGIQSLCDPVLKTLGRIHDSEAGKKAILASKSAGFSNLSCDMMLGIPGQTMEDVRSTLQFFLENKVPHVSLYSLILEEGTPMFETYQGDIEKFVSQEQDRAMYHEVVNTLKEHGFSHYEISNMSLPGYESRHNLMYWRAEEYYAFGLGAHYYLQGERGTHKAETVDEYIASLRKEDIRKEDIYEVEERISEEDQKKEFMMLGFRTGSGVKEQDFEKRFGVKMESAFAEEIRREQKAGLIEHIDGSYRLTDKGFDLANQVFSDYI